MRQSLSETSEVVEVHGLVKTFGATRALDGLDLSVRTGEVHGFLGPNGAGKTTAIRAMLGQLRADAGSVQLFGLHPVRDVVDIHRRLAYVPGDTVLWPALTGGECIDLIGRFRGNQDILLRDQLIERFELDSSKRVRTYSKGNRQKVALIAALCARAELLLLDEPTSGLDPLMESVFQHVIRELNDDGTTVLLSSHIMSEVESLCSRVTIIRAGRSVSTGNLSDLRARLEVSVESVTRQPISGLDALLPASAISVSGEPGRVNTQLTVPADAMPAVVELVAAQQPQSLVVRPPTLDELFLAHYHDAPESGGA